MSKIKWKDTTSYARGAERIPTKFTAKSGPLSITITCGHIYYKGQWVMHCHRLGIDTKPLPDGLDIEQAKKFAVESVRTAAETLLEHANRIGEQLLEEGK